MQALFIRHVFALGFSFILGLYLVPLMIRSAYKLRFLDTPDGQIKKHEKAIPYLGGVAVFISFITTIGFIYPFANHLVWFLTGITLLLFVGLIDDLKVLKPHQKLLGQFAAVLCFLKGGFSLRVNFFSTYLSTVASAFWMLSIINAFNLVDVMDGLSSSLAISSALSFFVIALICKEFTVSILLLAFIGALCAFFLYNKPPAKIYLGDAGSLFVGGFFAAIPLLFSWSSFQLDGYFAPFVILSIPLLMLGVPLLEISTLVVIRSYKGIPFYRGSPDHFSIYLKNRKWTVNQVLLFSTLSSLFLSAVGILFLLQWIHFFHLIGIMLIFSIAWFGTVFYQSWPFAKTNSVPANTQITPATKSFMNDKKSSIKKNENKNHQHEIEN